MKIRLVTVVWGDFFIDTFLRVTVRSLLADGNMPALAARHSVLYTIQTTQEGKRVLDASPEMQLLIAAVPTEFQIFDPAVIEPHNLAQHWFFWRQVAADARVKREILFFVIPDMLFAVGTLVRWAGFFEAGFHAVWTSVPQVALEPALIELEQRYPVSAVSAIAIDTQAISRLFIRQMHPVMVTMFRDSRRWTWHPEIVFACVPGQGLVMRAICSHLFCVDLNHFTMSDAFSPIDRLEDIAFDQVVHGVCFERLLKHTDLYYRPKKMEGDRLSNLGSWIDVFCTTSDMLESYHNYRFLVGSAESEEVSFRYAEISLGFYAGQVRLTGSIYRVVRAIRGAGCRTAAQIVACAHFAARLRRHWRIKGQVTLLVPTDEAIAAADAGAVDELLMPGNEKTLIEALLAHMRPGKWLLTAGDVVASVKSPAGYALTSAAGESFCVAQQGPAATVVSGPIEVDDCTLYLIDCVLIAGAESGRPSERLSALRFRWGSSPRRSWQEPALAAAEPTSGRGADSSDHLIEAPTICAGTSPSEAAEQLPPPDAGSPGLLPEAPFSASAGPGPSDLDAVVMPPASPRTQPILAVKTQVKRTLRATYQLMVAFPVLRPIAHRAGAAYLAVQARRSESGSAMTFGRALLVHSRAFTKYRTKMMLRPCYRAMVAMPPTRRVALRAGAAYLAVQARRQRDEDTPPITFSRALLEHSRAFVRYRTKSVVGLLTRVPAPPAPAGDYPLPARQERVETVPTTGSMLAPELLVLASEAESAEPALEAEDGAVPSSEPTRPAASIPGQEAIERLRDIQAARVVLNLEEVLRSHRERVGELAQTFPVLAMVQSCLEKAGVTDERLMSELQRLLAAEPAFPEAWLELGYAHFDRENYAVAERCFDESLLYQPCIPLVVGRLDCPTLAAFARAAAIEARGRLREAAEAYATALARNTDVGMAHIAYARLLRRLGRVRQALEEFEAGMETDLTALGLDSLPRRFSELAVRLEAKFGPEPAVDSDIMAV